MKKHTKIYLDFFGYSTADVILCEACGEVAVDVHHIEDRGAGGDPQGKRDVIENLIGLCRRCHDRAHRIAEPPIERDELKEIHARSIAIRKQNL
jgi:5-methylcytosine-specific restriction endonuclease McrA